jgi:hypothetical protein
MPLLMAEALPGANRVTLGADKGYDAHDFIAQNDTNRRAPSMSAPLAMLGKIKKTSKSFF